MQILIAPPLLHRCELHQRGDGFAFIRVRLDHHLPPETDPAPLAHKAGTTEEIALHAQPIEATHVARRIDPARNMRRFYRLSVQRDLFGRASLVREWGRIGFRGQMMVETHPDEGKAITALMKLAAVKKRRGYEDLHSGD